MIKLWYGNDSNFLVPSSLNLSIIDKLYIIIFDIHSYQGHISAALVLGGVDVNGPHLYSVYPHGSTDKLPYVTMGELTTNYAKDIRG